MTTGELSSAICNALAAHVGKVATGDGSCTQHCSKLTQAFVLLAAGDDKCAETCTTLAVDATNLAVGEPNLAAGESNLAVGKTNLAVAEAKSAWLRGRLPADEPLLSAGFTEVAAPLEEKAAAGGSWAVAKTKLSFLISRHPAGLSGPSRGKVRWADTLLVRSPRKEAQPMVFLPF